MKEPVPPVVPVPPAPTPNDTKAALDALHVRMAELETVFHQRRLVLLEAEQELARVQLEIAECRTQLCKLNGK